MEETLHAFKFRVAIPTAGGAGCRPCLELGPPDPEGLEGARANAPVSEGKTLESAMPVLSESSDWDSCLASEASGLSGCRAGTHIAGPPHPRNQPGGLRGLSPLYTIPFTKLHKPSVSNKNHRHSASPARPPTTSVREAPSPVISDIRGLFILLVLLSHGVLFLISSY